jgi:hypothetical protein
MTVLLALLPWPWPPTACAAASSPGVCPRMAMSQNEHPHSTTVPTKRIEELLRRNLAQITGTPAPTTPKPPAQPSTVVQGIDPDVAFWQVTEEP